MLSGKVAVRLILCSMGRSLDSIMGYKDEGRDAR